MRVQEGNILDVYGVDETLGGGRGRKEREQVGIQPPPLRRDGENQNNYTCTRPAIQPKERTSRAGLVSRKKHHRPRPLDITTTYTK